MRNFLMSTLAIATLAFTSAPAFSSEHLEVGKIDCDVSAGIGVIVGSQKEVSCAFTPSQSGSQEHYSGKITEFGVDIGETAKAKMTWLVYAPATRSRQALAGTYAGVSADAAVGLGLGANVLLGGDHGTITLQPISIVGEEGVNIAAGVTALTLQAAR